MCKTYPGPRCGSHALQRWEATSTAAEKARERVESAVNALTAADTVTNRRALDLARENYRVKADKELEARAEWNSTPEGQKRLTRMLEKAQEQNDQTKVDSLSKELNAAKEMRAEHMEANRLMVHAQRNYERLELNDRTRFDERKEQIENLGKELTQTAVAADKAHAEVLRYEKMVTSRAKEVRAAANPVKQAHEKVRQAALAKYLSAGIPAERAEHYALDTAASMQSGWVYLSEDSADRAPVYANAPTVKVKQGDHPDAEATQRVAELLTHDEDYQTAVANTAHEHEQFHLATQNLGTAKEVHKEAKKAFYHASQNIEEKKKTYRNSLRSLQHDIAAKTTGLPEEKYHVSAPQFIASTYVQEDGGTNAYVLTTLSKKQIPCYVQVTSRGEDNIGQYVHLKTGEKVYSSEVISGNRSLMLVKPESKEQKMFA